MGNKKNTTKKLSNLKSRKLRNAQCLSMRMRAQSFSSNPHSAIMRQRKQAAENESATTDPSEKGSILKSYLLNQTLDQDPETQNKVKQAKKLILQTEKSITLDDVIAFISHVKSRPLVYDPRSTDNLPGTSEKTHADIIEETWIELSLLMNWSVELCKQRWRSLKLAYILHLQAQVTGQNCENYRFLPYLDFMKAKVTAHSLQDEIENVDEELSEDDLQDPEAPETAEAADEAKSSEEDLDECMVELPEEENDVDSDPLETSLAIPRVPNSFDKPTFPGVGDEIREICQLSRIGESYFDFFRSIDLDYSLLTPGKKNTFIRSCSATLKHFYMECN